MDSADDATPRHCCTKCGMRATNLVAVVDELDSGSLCGCCAVQALLIPGVALLIPRPMAVPA